MALSDSFWQTEQDTLAKLLAPFLGRIAGNAAKQAAEDVGVAWDVVNADVQRWAEAHAGELAQGLTQTTRDQLGQTISDWIESGAPLDDLIADLSALFAPNRAALIGTTEVTRAYANGNRLAWAASPLVTGMRYMTVNDGTVCDECGPLDGQTFALDDDGNAPPLHPRCRCYLQPVLLDDGEEP